MRLGSRGPFHGSLLKRSSDANSRYFVVRLDKTSMDHCAPLWLKCEYHIGRLSGCELLLCRGSGCSCSVGLPTR